MRNSYKDTYAKFYNKGRQAALVKLASNGVPDFLDPNRPTVEDKPVSFIGDLNSKITSGDFGPAPRLAPGTAGVTSGYGDFLGDLNSKITSGNFGPAPRLAPGAASASGNIRPARRSRKRLTPQQLLAKVNPGRNTRYRPAIDQDRLNRALGNSSAQASSMDRAGYRDMMRSMGYV